MEFINAKDLPLSGPMAESHGIIVLQDGKLRYMSLAEFQNYMASASIETDPTLAVGGVAADAAATGAAVKNARPLNLLDNSDFRNPVNQRDFAGGVPNTDNSYFIDRWKTQQSATKNINISLTDSGLNIKVSTALAGICQIILKPKTGVTFAAKVNGKISLVYAAHGVDESVKTEDNVLLYVDWLEDVLQVIIRNTGEEANEYTIEWAALYEGEYTAETLPTYQPKGYGAELAECFRYFVDLGRCSVAAKDQWGFYYGDVRFPTDMRIPPTVVVKNPTTGKANAIGKWNGSTFVDFTDISIGTLTRKLFGLGSPGGTLAAGVSYTFEATASADL